MISRVSLLPGIFGHLVTHGHANSEFNGHLLVHDHGARHVRLRSCTVSNM